MCSLGNPAGNIWKGGRGFWMPHSPTLSAVRFLASGSRGFGLEEEGLHIIGRRCVFLSYFLALLDSTGPDCSHFMQKDRKDARGLCYHGMASETQYRYTWGFLVHVLGLEGMSLFTGVVSV